jgi:hypothetical protein
LNTQQNTHTIVQPLNTTITHQTSPGDLLKLVDGYPETFTKEEQALPLLSEDVALPVAQQSIGSGKLSKKYLFNLPEGWLLVSNLIVGPGGPFDRAFVEHVAPLQRRELQWKRIVAAGANQRRVHLHKGTESTTRFSYG